MYLSILNVFFLLFLWVLCSAFVIFSIAKAILTFPPMTKRGNNCSAFVSHHLFDGPTGALWKRKGGDAHVESPQPCRSLVPWLGGEPAFHCFKTQCINRKCEVGLGQQIDLYFYPTSQQTMGILRTWTFCFVLHTQKTDWLEHIRYSDFYRKTIFKSYQQYTELNTTSQLWSIQITINYNSID